MIPSGINRIKTLYSDLWDCPDFWLNYYGCGSAIPNWDSSSAAVLFQKGNAIYIGMRNPIPFKPKNTSLYCLNSKVHPGYMAVKG